MNPRFAVLAAFLMGAIAYQTGPPAAAPQSKGGPQTQAKRDANGSSGESRAAQEDWPRTTIYEFLTTRSNARNEAQSNANNLKRSLSIDFLIATVPDPQNSHFPVIFDRFVESISLALQDSGYTLDSFWLPWEAVSGLPDTDWQNRNEHRAWQAKRLAHPGILLFRSQPNGKPDSLMGVLLIGEDPIRGINKDQFAESLSLIAEFRRPGGDKTVRVLGPTFSGSIPSLGIAMRNSDDAEIAYQVATGSATGASNGDHLEAHAGQHKVIYQTAIAYDDNAIPAFFSYLTRLPHPVDWKRIAILAEWGTAYGTQFVESRSVRGASANTSNTDLPLVLDYPMELSRLRNAYADDPEISVLSSANATKVPRQGLQINLKDVQVSQDSIPSFSQELTPVSQEAALMNTLATISREQIEYVGIVASDILDAIFLGRLLKQHCPDVRLFVVDSDLVYAHIDQRASFEGMLMVTSYPLLTENQRWTNSWSGRRQRRQFSSATAEGVYNAGLLLLKTVPHIENVAPLVEYASPPPLWLTVVGRDGIWPVTTLDAGRPPIPNALTETSRGWKLLFWLVTLFCAFFAAGLIGCNLGPDQAGKIGQGRLSVLYVGSDDYSTTVQVSLAAALGVLLIAHGFMAAVQISFFSLSGYQSAARALSCVSIPALLPIAALACWRAAKAARWEWIAAAAASLPASALFYSAIYRHPLPLLFVYRAVHVGNGVSPVIPMLLLSIALLWYSEMQLNRVRLCRTRAVELPSFPADMHLCCAPKVMAELSKTLDNWWFGKWSWTVAPLLGLGIGLLKPMRSIETFPFEWPYAAGLCLLFAALWMGCVRFFSVWFHLRRLLRTIERHPIHAAFGRLPPELSPTTVWRWQGDRVYLTLAQSIERLRTLAEIGMPTRFADGRDFRTHLDDLEGDARELIAADTLGTPAPEAKLKTVGSTVVTFSDYLLENVLASFWRQGSAAGMQAAMATSPGVSGAAQIASPPAISPAVTIAAEEYVALRFVALIRYVTLHLKNLLEFVAGALILALVSLNSYPFEPRHLITTAISVCFFAGAAAFAGALLQMHRSAIVNYRGDGKPIKLDANLLHVLSFGALPLLTVLASQFPSIGGFLFAWVKPALENLW